MKGGMFVNQYEGLQGRTIFVTNESCSLICYNKTYYLFYWRLFMGLTLYWYPNCNTSKKAKKWLEDHDLTYTLVHLVEETPNEATISELMDKSDLSPRRFFNTSGKVYREQNMKNIVKVETKEEIAQY